MGPVGQFYDEIMVQPITLLNLSPILTNSKSLFAQKSKKSNKRKTSFCSNSVEVIDFSSYNKDYLKQIGQV